MASIIEGYNYDIFVSYRQKDNKYDGWVTEFVENLKKELEATFKEEISVYFDINPHDGLLETHDVDESLKEKLKCLIFIPIISRTYCDPKAFAWEHEFKVFVDQASKDQYGLKVKLPNGNVASRVLPIVIYDLDKQDIKLFESVIGSVLRGVEFIYKTAGVNRPLRSKEEKPHENLNNTLYRDQVNKVANTIKDVLNSLTIEGPSVEEAKPGPSVVDEKIPARKPARKKSREIPTVSLLYRVKKLVTFSQRTWRIIALVLLIISVGTYWFGSKNESDATITPKVRYDIPIERTLSYTERKSLAISHNGEYLVYVTGNGFYLKSLNNDAPAILISGTSGTRYPVFSADDNWIAYELVSANELMKMPLTGGNPISICDLGGAINGMNWYENEIIFAVGSSIYQVHDTGGTPELLYPLNKSDNDPWLWNPQLLPDKKTLLFSQQTGDSGWSILTWRLGSKESPSVLVEQGRDGRYLKSGHLVYSLNNRLYISKFNSRTNRIVSEPQIIAASPVFEFWRSNYGASQFDFSENGILVYYVVQRTNQNQYNLIWVDEAGTVSPPVTNQAKSYITEAISSDAQYIASAVSGNQVEIINIKTGNSQLFAEDAWTPSWSADNSFVYYVSTVTFSQVFQKPLDLSTPPALLFEIDYASGAIALYDISTDGKYLLFDVGSGGKYDIGYYDIINNKVEMLEHYNHPDCDDHRPVISPDGKWIAYRSNYSGQAAIYVAPFPGPGQPVRVTSPRSANDIMSTAWDPDMTALYYYTTNPDFELWRINMKFSENGFSFEPAQSFFNGGNNFTIGWNLEIHPNGDRFLIQQRESAIEETTESRIKVIVNWEQELEGK